MTRRLYSAAAAAAAAALPEIELFWGLITRKSYDYLTM